MMPVWRRAGRVHVAVAGHAVAGLAGAAVLERRSVDIALDLPVELQHLPPPPVLEAAPIQILDRDEELPYGRVRKIHFVPPAATSW